ncbi:hypothetical protein [Arcobacter defluvii]|uniref:Uncharacterized protein n=1 Tax=Arcobacter defluvii TaxID=873191 RepID=A0AAE7BEN7_9BACT|nr:hypothetical protein [Arcobacter defluvii]QKF76352.1 hypothetical protein ADFLV_0289 [Arcobacter defluvii]RXI29466.1 hypothetical protein CP964_13810 [Arcobacter defluvii]
MRRLKNWTVIMKSISQKNKDNVKSFLNLYEYIYDLKNQHPNHNLKEFHKVVGFEDRHPQISKNFLNLQMKIDIEKNFLISGKKASGRKSSYGKSILLSLPSSIQLEEKDYKRIRDLILIRLVNFISSEYKLNYDKSQRDRFINNYILSTAHLQNSNNHINILVPNVFIDYKNENKLLRIDLGKRRFSYFIKQSFNYIMLQYFNNNYLDYEIQAHNKISKKTNSQYYYKLKQVEEQKQDLTHQISNMKNLFNLTNENFTKLQKRVDIYLNRMDTAIQEQNKEKFEKNKELIERNLEKIKEELQKDYSKTPSKPDLLSIFDKIKIELENKSYTNTKSGLTR